MEKGKNVSVYCGSRYGINPAHTAFAGMAGELLAKNGYTMIYGGGSVGLMGIAADAALAAGGKVVGIIPEVFIAAEQAHRLITELIEVPDLMARKRKMIEAGDAFLILPGGFGTLEEFADTAVHYHIYTEETNRPPIIIANIVGKYPFHQFHQRASSSSSLKRKILTPVLRQAFLFVRISVSTGISKHSLSFCFHSVHFSVPETYFSFYTPASFYYYLYFLRQYLVKTDNSVLYTLPLCYN